jgi:hypothetical protein
MSCSDCLHWITARVTDYENGDRIFNLQCAEGKGACEQLKIETDADFGCAKHEPGTDHVIVMGKKLGCPWHHYVKGECPDCKGRGWECKRCAGTGEVRYYDDGFVGENQTYIHPKDAKLPGGRAPDPVCFSCDGRIELSWKACPHCGVRFANDDTQRRVGRTGALSTGGDGVL